MQIVRTIVWVLLLSALVIFTWANWEPKIDVHIGGHLMWETRLPAVVVISFLLGLLPMWLLHKVAAYSARRRISSLETAARSAAVSPAPAPADTVVAAEQPAESPGPLKSE